MPVRINAVVGDHHPDRGGLTHQLTGTRHETVAAVTAGDVEPAAEALLDAVPHRADAHTGGEATTQAAPVVADGEQQVTVVPQPDATGPSSGVSQHVGHRLAGDGQNSRFDRGQRPEARSSPACPPAERWSGWRCVPAACSSQPGCGHHLIAQLVDVGADLVHPVPQLSPGRRPPAPGPCRVDQRSGDWRSRPA